jgi:hypothetical protein
MATDQSMVVQPRVSNKVAPFAAEHGVDQYLPDVLEMTRRVFPCTRRIDVFVEEDAEVPEDRRIIVEVEVQLPPSEAVAAQHRWNREISQCCPSTNSWVFVLGMWVVE